MAHDTTTTTSPDTKPEEVIYPIGADSAEALASFLNAQGKVEVTGPVTIGDRRFIPDTFAPGPDIWFGDMRWIGLVAVIGTPQADGYSLDTKFDMISQPVMPLERFVEDVRVRSEESNETEVYEGLLEAIKAGDMGQDNVNEMMSERALNDWVTRVQDTLEPGQVICRADHYDISSQVWVTPRAEVTDLLRLSNGEQFQPSDTAEPDAG